MDSLGYFTLLIRARYFTPFITVFWGPPCKEQKNRFGFEEKKNARGS